MSFVLACYSTRPLVSTNLSAKEALKIEEWGDEGVQTTRQIISVISASFFLGSQLELVGALI